MTAPTTSPPPSPSPRTLSLRMVAMVLLGLLGIELVLGAVLDVAVTLPMGASVTSVLSSQPVLDLHILVALLLIGLSGHAVARSRREPTRRLQLAAALALLSALIASAGGWEFVFNGQNMVSAAVMTLGFVGVLVGAVLMRLWSSGDAAPTAPRPASS
ncbi:MAG: hypothetical protein ACLPZM_05840 [Thermoplasmata archaeon]